MMDATWDPATYRRYATERDRPFHDLIVRIDTDPRHIADLGCGDGHHTQTLHRLWPEAEIIGVDSSPEMFQEARTDSHKVRFELADLTKWRPSIPRDLIVSNAALHWIPEHPTLLDHLLGLLSPGGILAVQIPYNHDAPSHRAVRTLADEDPWRDTFQGLGAVHVLTPEHYIDELRRRGTEVDLWTTTYHHLLTGPDGVLEWLKGTTLRPYLRRLDPSGQEAFLSRLGGRLRNAYPEHHGRVVYPFKRLFFVVMKR